MSWWRRKTPVERAQKLFRRAERAMAKGQWAAAFEYLQAAEALDQHTMPIYDALLTAHARVTTEWSDADLANSLRWEMRRQELADPTVALRHARLTPEGAQGADMKIFALTGGIATGKTTVGEMFVALGATRVDADQIVHALYEQDEALQAQVRQLFGDAVCDSAGAIDRAVLATRVVADATARKALEAVVHPRVMVVMAEAIALARQQQVPLLCCDVPLLFEAGLDRQFDTVVLTTCDPQTQIQRVMRRYRCDAAAAAARIALQWPLTEKISRAQFVIATDASLTDTRRAVEQVFAQL